MGKADRVKWCGEVLDMAGVNRYFAKGLAEAIDTDDELVLWLDG